MKRPKWVYGMILLLAAAATGPTPRAMGQDLSGIDSEHTIYFSGKVMLDDGSAPADAVRIERVCDGRTTFEAWTDEKGTFSFKVAGRGRDTTVDDASRPDPQAPNVNRPLNASASQYSNPVTSALRGCQLQADLAGYRSERVSIDVKSMMDDTRVGTIILHPLSRASALIVSATTLAAPPNAKKAYAKGLDAMHSAKWDVAAAEFNKAIKAYPKFAIAWYQLGLARSSRNDTAGAMEAWRQAQSIDPKYVKPYENLTAGADHQGDWAESEKYSRLWIRLDPEDFPAAYLFNAVANARLNKPEEAERAAREGLRVDKDQKIPRLNYVLGLILMDKKEYGASAGCFRRYLELAPNAGDAAMVRQQLPKLEELAAAPAK
jgi:tetratricopeptide (TPR) repeat protein